MKNKHLIWIIVTCCFTAVLAVRSQDLLSLEGMENILEREKPSMAAGLGTPQIIAASPEMARLIDGGEKSRELLNLLIKRRRLRLLL